MVVGEKWQARLHFACRGGFWPRRLCVVGIGLERYSMASLTALVGGGIAQSRPQNTLVISSTCALRATSNAEVNVVLEQATSKRNEVDSRQIK